MLAKLKQLLETNNDREKFFRLIKRFFPEGSADYCLIEKAYVRSKEAFRGKYRDGGEVRYFEHLRGVTLILIEILRCRDAEMIAAALLHDIIEDIDGWDQARVASEFTQRVSELVWWVTKPALEDFGGDKNARDREYHQKLNDAPRDAVIIKLADRLHNVLTLWTTGKEKQVRKVRETEDFYLPLTVKFIILIHEIETALDEIKESWKREVKPA